MCIAYTHDRTRISFQFLFIQNIYILFENERGWDFVLYHLFILFSSICLNEAVAQLTDEQRWWRHRVRCCSNRRYVLACSQVCAWSTDLPSTCLQVIESVARVLGIEKRPQSPRPNILWAEFRLVSRLAYLTNRSIFVLYYVEFSVKLSQNNIWIS